MSEQLFDCVVIGAGPAGLAAALYAARDSYNTLILEKMYPGGQINNTDRIENYPGIVRIAGPDLIEEMTKQATQFGAQIRNNSEVTAIKKLSDDNIRITCDDEKYTTKAVILTPGSDYRKLGVPGEEEFRNAGAGVSYCGTCDAPFFRDRKVVAVGGGNTAMEETLHLAKFASEITLVHRRKEFRATKILADELLAMASQPDSNLKIRYDSVVTAVQGEDKVQSVRLKNVLTNKEDDVSCDGIFIFIGMVPNTKFLTGFVPLTENGFIKCDPQFLRTPVPGVFVAGDCRVGAAMQLATAVGDGVLTAMMLKQYFRDPEWWNQGIDEKTQLGGW